MQGGLDRIPRTARKSAQSINKVSQTRTKRVSLQNISVHLSITSYQTTTTTINSDHHHQKPSDEHEIISLDLVNIGDILERLEVVNLFQQMG